MIQEHQLTPPPELVEQWLENTRSQDCIGAYPANYEQLICTQAARWGADQELEACCVWLRGNDPYEHDYHQMLRAARRPKPPSLKEQALEAARRFYAKGHEDCTDEEIKEDFDTIRRALERLQELENND